MLIKKQAIILVKWTENGKCVKIHGIQITSWESCEHIKLTGTFHALVVDSSWINLWRRKAYWKFLLECVIQFQISWASSDVLILPTKSSKNCFFKNPHEKHHAYCKCVENIHTSQLDWLLTSVVFSELASGLTVIMDWTMYMKTGWHARERNGL